MKSNTILYGALAVAALALIRRKPVSGIGSPRKYNYRQLSLFADDYRSASPATSTPMQADVYTEEQRNQDIDEAMQAMQDYVSKERASRYVHQDDYYYEDGTPVEYIDIDDGSVYHYGDSIDIWKVTGAWGTPTEEHELLYTIEGEELETAHQIIQRMQAKALRFGYILEIQYNVDDQRQYEWRGDLHSGRVAGMQDPEASLDNIRRGVANGWYKAKRTMVNGKPAVELSGRTKDGKLYTDVYPVSLETYNKLT